MVDKITSDAKVYTDLQSLERLRYSAKTNNNAAKKEVSQQFEALMMQMVLKSMRDANKAFTSDLFSGDQMAFYEDMYDKQLSMVTANSGTGFAQMIEKNLTQSAQVQNGIPPSTLPVHTLPLAHRVKGAERVTAPPTHSVKVAATPSSTTTMPPTNRGFGSKEDFISNLWEPAKAAAHLLGVDPKILIAQAALETHWGQKILAQDHGTSSFNLFNIKADSSWNQKTVTVATLEQKEGVLMKEKSSFRRYDSYIDSFKDYVSFLKNNARYSEALNYATHPKQFVQALQDAGYATDTNYADKIMKIFNSPLFKQIEDKLP